MKIGMTWEKIEQELDDMDLVVEHDNESYFKNKDQIMSPSSVHVGKRRSEVEPEWFECRYHEIKFHGCFGGCPLCGLRAAFETKELEASLPSLYDNPMDHRNNFS